MSIIDCINQFVGKHQLPLSYCETAIRHFVPLAQNLVTQANSNSQPLLIAIHGCQGSGKTTVTELLLYLFEQYFNLPSAGMSIDDFYLTQKQRLCLAENVHPLLCTRGVPGTHDTVLLANTLSGLTNFTKPVLIPCFNKAVDDRFDESHWTRITAAPSIIILEGWCVGATPQSHEALVLPINSLEQKEDEHGIWRRYVNERLSLDYQPIFQAFDRLVMLKAPGFYAVKNWRLQQEEKLRQKARSENGDLSKIMNKGQIERFIQHYQRITEHSLKVLPAVATDVYSLNDIRGIESVASSRGSS